MTDPYDPISAAKELVLAFARLYPPINETDAMEKYEGFKKAFDLIKGTEVHPLGLWNIYSAHSKPLSHSILPESFIDFYQENCDPHINNLLSVAATHSVSLTRKLLSYGLDVNTTYDAFKDTPKNLTIFSVAVFGGDERLMRACIDYNADPDIYPAHPWHAKRRDQLGEANLPELMKEARRKHATRKSILSCTPRPVKPKGNVSSPYTVWTGNTEHHLGRTLYEALGGRAIKVIKTDMDGGQLLDFEHDLKTPGPGGVTFYDAIFQRHDSADIFNPALWQNQPTKFEIFCEHLPAFYKRKYYDDYKTCRARFQHTEKNPPKLTPRKKSIKRRKGPKRK